MALVKKIKSQNQKIDKDAVVTKVRYSIITIFILSIIAQLVDNAFNLITPTLEANFNISSVLASLVPSIAGIGLAIGFLVFSSFSDFMSERKLLWFGLFLFIFPSIIGLSLQKYFYAVLVARFIQAAGGIATSAIYLFLVARYLPNKEKVIWMGLSTTSFMLSTIIGTLAGGFLTENFGWQVIFYIPFFAVLGVPFLWKTMPIANQGFKKIEPTVFLLLAAVAIILNFLASMPDNWIIWIVAIVIIGTFLLYVFKSKNLEKQENPILTKAMLKNKGYMLSLLATFFYYLAQVAIVVLLPYLLAKIYGLSEDQAAISYIIPYSVAALIATFSGKIIKIIGFNKTILIGGSLVIFGFIMLGFLGSYDVAVVQVFFTFIVSGYALSFSPMLNRSISFLPPKQVGIGIGMFNFVLRIALALGISIGAFMLDSQLKNVDFLGYTPDKSDVFVIIFWVLALFTFIGLFIYFIPVILKFFSKEKSKMVDKKLKDLIIKKLKLVPLENEGGLVRNTYISEEDLNNRKIGTAIYYLLSKNAYSHLHKLSADEIWHHYIGDSVEMVTFDEKTGAVQTKILGKDIKKENQPQILVPKNVWQGAKLSSKQKYGFALMGTTMTPGYEEKDFVIAKPEEIINKFPKHKSVVKKYTGKLIYD